MKVDADETAEADEPRVAGWVGSGWRRMCGNTAHGIRHTAAVWHGNARKLQRCLAPAPPGSCLLPSQAHFPLLLLCCTPLAAAAFIAASRITDYKHERADVNAGAALGAACGLAAYLLNFHRYGSTAPVSICGLCIARFR